MQDSQVDFCRRLARALARQFGSGCEVVVHDLRRDPEHSVVAIENGHVTGRQVGDGPSRVVLEALHAGADARLEDRIGYLTKTADGKVLKSSTIFIRDEDGAAVGILAINFDITLMRAARDLMTQMCDVEQTAPAREPQPIVRNVATLLDDLLEQSVELVGTPVALMTREEKVRAIRYLNDSGAFLITKSGHRVCKFFGISKYTLYSYLDEARALSRREASEGEGDGDGEPAGEGEKD